MEFKSRLSELKNLVDLYIDGYLQEMEPPLSRPGLRTLFESINYSLAEGGGRLRPILAMLTAEALGCDPKSVMALGGAVEMIHTYSLIHDDLPCMDDDDERRGKPSNHKKFGEAMAVLAGDALVTEAFMLLSRKYSETPQLAVDLVQELALSSGAHGMVGGQAVDVALKGRDASTAEIEFLHSFKTGALFRMSVLGAGRICGANAFQLKSLAEYARCLGLIFQITDDIADGAKADEPSVVKAMGLDAARAACGQLVVRAQAAVEPFGENALGLKQLVQFLFERGT